jgi:hypothetical protein
MVKVAVQNILGHSYSSAQNGFTSVYNEWCTGASSFPELFGQLASPEGAALAPLSRNGPNRRLILENHRRVLTVRFDDSTHPEHV